MKPTLTKSDNLASISYENENLDVNDQSMLRNQVSAADGSITIISGFGCSLVLNWSFSSTAININVVLQTPVGGITLINATLDAQNPSITFGGSVGPFKAEGTVSFDFSAMTLTASGEVCAPFAGCKSGSVTIGV